MMKVKNFSPLLFGFGLGTVATLSQIVIIRKFLSIPGITEISLGWLLFCWLSFVALGAYLSKKDTSTVLFLVLSVFVAPLILGCFLLLGSYEILFHLPLGQPIGLAFQLFLGALLAFPFAFLVGYGFTHASYSFNVLHIYIGEAIGALVSGVLFIFLFINTIDSTTLVMASLALFCSTIGCCF